MRILADLARGVRVLRFRHACVATKDGRLIDVSVTISPIRDADGPHRRRLEDRARHDPAAACRGGACATARRGCASRSSRRRSAIGNSISPGLAMQSFAAATTAVSATTSNCSAAGAMHTLLQSHTHAGRPRRRGRAAACDARARASGRLARRIPRALARRQVCTGSAPHGSLRLRDAHCAHMLRHRQRHHRSSKQAEQAAPDGRAAGGREPPDPGSQRA